MDCYRLFVSSRVKADKDSRKLAELGAASKSVNSCTAEVVAVVKSGQQSLSDESESPFHYQQAEYKPLYFQDCSTLRTSLSTRLRPRFGIAPICPCPYDWKNISRRWSLKSERLSWRQSYKRSVLSWQHYASSTTILLH